MPMCILVHSNEREALGTPRGAHVGYEKGTRLAYNAHLSMLYS